jgi:RNA polymerase sigma-70 factor (ECF subfamily)
MERNEGRSEGALVTASINGDAEAFEALYLRYMNPIYRYFYFRVGDALQAEDMTEEVFVKAWEALPRYKHKQQPFYGWLYRIAHNLLVDFYRKRNPLPLSENMLALQRDKKELPEGELRRKQEIEQLVWAVQQLSDIEQQVVLLRFVEGLPHREIASIIGKSLVASRVIQHRAIKALRTILANEEVRNEG